MIRGGLVQRDQGYGVYASSYDKQNRHGPGAATHEERPHVFVAGRIKEDEYSEPLKPENITRTERSINYNDVFQRRPTDITKQLADILARAVGRSPGPGGPSGPGPSLGGGSLGGGRIGPTNTLLPPTNGTTPPTMPQPLAPTPPLTPNDVIINIPDSDDDDDDDDPFSDKHKVTDGGAEGDDPFSDKHKITDEEMEQDILERHFNLPDPKLINNINDVIQDMDIINTDAENLTQELINKNKQLKIKAAENAKLNEQYQNLFKVLTYNPNLKRRRDDGDDDQSAIGKKRNTTDADIYAKKLAISAPEITKELVKIASDIKSTVNEYLAASEDMESKMGESDLSTKASVAELLKIAYPKANMSSFKPRKEAKESRKPYTRRTGGEKSVAERAARKQRDEDALARGKILEAKRTIKLFGNVSKDKLSTKRWKLLQEARDLISKTE